jgi:AcrR family transcriptional regulator
MMPANAPAAGRRAQNKADKLNRIREAARELFTEKGYDATTMRDIAARGGVGFGTIFDYASGKRDLLFLILNPELDRALQEGQAAAAAEVRFIEQIMALFGSYYRLFRMQPNLFRYFLRELNFYEDTAEAAKFVAHRALFLSHVTQIVERAKLDGRIDNPESADVLATSLFSLYAWEVRRWISLEPAILSEGLSRLRRLILVQVQGFGLTEPAD